jgi:sulfur-oxidizing protein SoxZ
MTAELARPRIRAPRSARAGEVVEIRTLIEHPMETGLRQQDGRAVPRDLLDRITVAVNGELVLQAELRNGTAANPYHVFFLRIERSSRLSFTWTHESGRSVTATAEIAVA